MVFEGISNRAYISLYFFIIAQHKLMFAIYSLISFLLCF
jgi:hypothetical protein